MGGRGRSRSRSTAKPAEAIRVGGVPRLYTLFQASSSTTGTLSLSFSPGVQAYDFTFG